MSLINVLAIIFKHKWKIILNFIIIVAVVTVGTFFQKPVFEAKASLLVKMMRDDSSRPGMGPNNNNLALILSQDEIITTEIQILTSRELAEKVITDLKPETLYPDLAGKSLTKADLIHKATRTFGKNLEVLGVKKTNVITVSFQHNDPQIAARAVNLLVEKFQDKHLALHSNPQSHFIDSQLASFEDKLKASERELQEYQEKNKVFSLEEQRGLLLKQRNDFDTAYKLAHDNVSENEKKIASLKSQMKYMASNNARYTPTDRDRIVVDAKARLLELQLKEQELRAKYTGSNGLVVEAKRQVEMVNRFLKDQEAGIVGKVKTGNPVYQNMEMDLFRAEAELKSQAAKAAALKIQLKQLSDELAVIDMSESKVQNLKRQLAINEKNYMTYADRHEEARISAAMNRSKLSNISIIESAIVPAKPIKPNKQLSILLATLFGIISGLVYAYMLESIGQTFSDAESVENFLGVPVLLTVRYKED